MLVMKTVCDFDMCVGCMACVGVCHKNAITIDKSVMAYNAIINEDKCSSCDMCKKICQNNNELDFYDQINVYQGWARDEILRAQGSSGGVATAIMHKFIQDGGIVCSCLYKNDDFVFEFVNKIDEITKFSGSKYVKSNTNNIYQEIIQQLKNQNNVLFVGLPCQVAGLKTLVDENLSRYLYTIDLICHGTPDIKIFKKYVNSQKYDLKSVDKIIFRDKEKYKIYGIKKGERMPVVPEGIEDNYLFAFMNGLCLTNNCYYCKFARLKRVSDITLGDSLGSSLQKEREQGISLILCQTEKGQGLIQNSNISLNVVDLDNAIKNNQQLSHPITMPNNRDRFFRILEKVKSFSITMLFLYPKRTIKQSIKKCILKWRK